MPPVMTADTAIAHRPSSSPKRGPERGAREHDEEEDPAAAAGEVDQPQQSGARREHAEERDGRAVHRAPADLEHHRGDDQRTDERGHERRVAGVGLAR